MTNSTKTLALLADAESDGSFCVTVCAEHGTRSTADLTSARHYVDLIESWRGVRHTDPLTSPWWCCDGMQVDPRGYAD